MAEESYFEVLTTVFIPKEKGAGYHSIQFYCRRCGEELECPSCGWVPGTN